MISPLATSAQLSARAGSIRPAAASRPVASSSDRRNASPYRWTSSRKLDPAGPKQIAKTKRARSGSSTTKSMFTWKTAASRPAGSRPAASSAPSASSRAAIRAIGCVRIASPSPCFDPKW